MGLQVPRLRGKSILGVPPCGCREVTRGEVAAKSVREGLGHMAMRQRSSSPMKLREMRNDEKASCWGTMNWQILQGLVYCCIISSREVGKLLGQIWSSILFLYSLRYNGVHIFKYLKKSQKIYYGMWKLHWIQISVSIFLYNICGCLYAVRPKILTTWPFAKKVCDTWIKP